MCQANFYRDLQMKESFVLRMPLHIKTRVLKHMCLQLRTTGAGVTKNTFGSLFLLSSKGIFSFEISGLSLLEFILFGSHAVSLIPKTL